MFVSMLLLAMVFSTKGAENNVTALGQGNPLDPPRAPQSKQDGKWPQAFMNGLGKASTLVVVAVVEGDGLAWRWV